MQSQADEDLGMMRSGMTSKIRQALVDLGLTDRTQLSGDALGFLDDPTFEAAKGNKYSLFQKVADQEAKYNAQTRAELAARGMLSSGQLTKSTQDILKNAEEQRYSGVREFSGTVGELLSAFAQRQRDWAQRIAEARFSGAGTGLGVGSYSLDTSTGREYDSPERGGRPGEVADLPVRVGWNPNKNSDAEYDMSGAQDMGGWFLGPNGVRYDANGRVI